MAKFFCDGTQIAAPADIIPSLAGGEKHWRKGRSAFELAHAWMDADKIPPAVMCVISERPEFAAARLVEGHFERTTPIPGRGKASQTDLLALCEARGERFVLGIEGKVDETLGPLVSEWDDASPNRRARLSGLIELLEANPAGTARLRYQLLHRTAAALIEAKHFGTRHAIMLVHSFDPAHAWFDDFSNFAAWLGAPCPSPGRLSAPLNRSGVYLYLGWCADKPAA
ncbi:hypothetical protein H0I76_18590 [Limibaculum sp. M0105]|uniref:DUF6946 domain-containing protein n=1 Tax=Thermohalobaculum xanthum TaxID=2753746 RepID=A0A8J7MBI9_9RHOB|nr:hypothetical protein [Thermohalobaculum xanthum]MBK0401212.1 hypothetical protein [Thermohalobaculum xanthum]